MQLVSAIARKIKETNIIGLKSWNLKMDEARDRNNNFEVGIE